MVVLRHPVGDEDGENPDTRIELIDVLRATGNSTVVCPACSGRGTIPGMIVYTNEHRGHDDGDEADCPECGGDGVICNRRSKAELWVLLRYGVDPDE